ncbi:MAG: hypothetical protein KI792_12680 [Alphaproteobacteria bacterium]|nr:hypothetical protein [Alphaproteobacteria bacterium SS10]
MFTMIVVRLAAALAGGFFMRARGMDILGSTTAQRIAYALAFAVMCWCVGLPWQYAAPLAVVTYLAHIRGWGAHQRMHPDVYGQTFDKTEKLTAWLPTLFGAWDDDWSAWKKTAYQITGMTVIGLATVAPMAVPLMLWDASTIGFAAVGLAWGVVYWLGWEVNRFWGLDWHQTWVRWQHHKIRKHLRSGGEWGEVFVGAITWAAAAGAILAAGV